MGGAFSHKEVFEATGREKEKKKDISRARGESSLSWRRETGGKDWLLDESVRSDGGGSFLVIKPLASTGSMRAVWGLKTRRCFAKRGIETRFGKEQAGLPAQPIPKT